MTTNHLAAEAVTTSRLCATKKKRTVNASFFASRSNLGKFGGYKEGTFSPFLIPKRDLEHASNSSSSKLFYDEP